MQGHSVKGTRILCWSTLIQASACRKETPLAISVIFKRPLVHQLARTTASQHALTSGTISMQVDSVRNATMLVGTAKTQTAERTVTFATQLLSLFKIHRRLLSQADSLRVQCWWHANVQRALSQMIRSFVGGVTSDAQYAIISSTLTVICAQMGPTRFTRASARLIVLTTTSKTMKTTSAVLTWPCLTSL